MRAHGTPGLTQPQRKATSSGARDRSFRDHRWQRQPVRDPRRRPVRRGRREIRRVTPGRGGLAHAPRRWEARGRMLRRGERSRRAVRRSDGGRSLGG